MRHLIVFICLSFFLASCATNTVVLTNVSERDSNEITLLLGSKGILATKSPSPAATGAATTEQNWDISVPSSRLTEALSILNQAGLPRARGTTLLDLFGSPGIVPSELQDKIRYQEGLSEQLAMTIRKMEGVLDANVQITFASETEGAVNKPLTASVYIRTRSSLAATNNILVTKIKRLVSSAIPGLTAENVTVVVDRAAFINVSANEPCVDEQNLVSIWSIAMPEDSASRFRMIFYTFIFIVFILASLLALLIWKLFPVLTDPSIKLVTPEQISRETFISTAPTSAPPPTVEEEL